MSKKTVAITMTKMMHATTTTALDLCEEYGFDNFRGPVMLMKAYAHEINRLGHALHVKPLTGLDLERLGKDIHDILFYRDGFDHPDFSDEDKKENPQQGPSSQDIPTKEQVKAWLEKTLGGEVEVLSVEEIPLNKDKGN